MTGLLVYTENYARGGGNQYMSDLVDCVAHLYERLDIASNPGGIYNEDISRLPPRSTVSSVPIISEHRTWADHHARAPRLTDWVLRAIRRYEDSAFEYNVRLLRRRIRRVQPSAVLACNGGYPAAPSVRAMVVAAHREHLPVVMSVVSMPESRREGRLDADQRNDELVWRSVTAVIANAAGIVDALTATRGMPAGLAHVVHNGVEDVEPRPRARPDRALVIGCVSRMEPLKGTGYLIDAFSQLAASRADARLMMVGEGRSRDDAEATIRERGLAGRCEFTGWFDGEIHDLLSTFDIFVLPSLWEGFPYVLLEAMRAGLPIVSTRVGGVPEAIEDGVSGILVEPASAESLVDALARVFDDPGLRESLGRAARERFERCFTMDAMRRAATEAFTSGGLA
jgi:glycosyltransferase involved in cell wall biosynthesis